jgi:hypothetical protein
VKRHAAGGNGCCFQRPLSPTSPPTPSTVKKHSRHLHFKWGQNSDALNLEDEMVSRCENKVKGGERLETRWAFGSR